MVQDRPSAGVTKAAFEVHRPIVVGGGDVMIYAPNNDGLEEHSASGIG